MTHDDVIDAYVADVLRHLPRKDRNEIGLELRGLLGEMLEDRARSDGRAALDGKAGDAMVLAMLRDFGTPVEVAARYRPPGAVAFHAAQARSFALISVIGIVLQWSLTLPRITDAGMQLGGWWLTWGLGAFWWPGFIAMFWLLAAWLRGLRWFAPKWSPRVVDPERVHRGALAFGLAWFAIGMTFMVCLPWLVNHLPGVLPQVFAFDPAFLRVRAWPVVVLWLASFATLLAMLLRGRRTPLLRKLELVSSLAFIALLAWWLVAGDIFQAPATNEGARGGLLLVIAIIAIDLLVKLFRRPARLRVPGPAR